MGLLRRVWNVVRRTRLDDELRQEMETHIALIEQEEQARGLSPERASERARWRFGNPLLHREHTLDALVAIWLDTFRQDLAFACRQLVRRRGFTVSIVLLLAMGIGLNIGIFTVINSVVLRALPLSDPDRLVIINERSGRFETPTSWPDFLDLRDRSRSLEASAAFTRSADVVYSVGGEARNVRSSSVTREYFSTLGVAPIAGRLFDAPEGELANGAALIREDFWQTALDADSTIIGKTIRVNGRAIPVVGILPAWFRFPSDDTVMWLPLKPSGRQADRGWHAFSMVGRLKPTLALAQAQADLNEVMQRLAREFPDKNAGRGASVRRLQDWSFNSALRDRLVVLQIAALVLCVIACANVSSLLLARYSSRRLEFSIRAALGATRARQMRQHVTESLLLTGAGCAVSISLAWGAVRFLVWLYGDQLPRAAEISADWRLVGIVTGVVMAIGVVLGLVTALHQEGFDLETSMRESNRTMGSLRALLTRRALVISQVVCAVVLLSVTAEVLQSFWSLLHVDIGINRANVLTIQINLPSAKYPGGAGVGAFFGQVVDSVRSLPGVTNAAAINMLPIAEWGFNGSVNVQGLPAQQRGFFAEYRWVTADYFRTMGVPLTHGRLFVREEIEGTQRAAIINEIMARRVWGTKDPLGAHVRFLSPEWITIVGIVRDIRQSGVTVPPSPEIFLPASAYQGPFSLWSVVVRSPLPTESLLPSIRRVVQRTDAEAAIARVKTMDQIVEDSMSNQRIVTTLLVAFGTLALVLAAVGIYSVVAYAVVLRTPELALRAALGSTPGALVRLVSGQGLALIGIGVVAGVAAAVPISWSLQKSMFGINGVALSVFAVVVATVTMAGLLATFIPAMRTARIDPLRALRQQ
jgi:putative ABC transport system permease protein